MILRVSRYRVEKRYPLTISRGTTAATDNLLVEIESDGVVGWGESCPTTDGDPPETTDDEAADLARWSDLLRDVSPWELQRIDEILDGAEAGSGARAGLDAALHDWIGKRLGVSVWRLLGLDPIRIVPTSVTVGICSPELLRERIPEILNRTGGRILKVKLGCPDGLSADQEIYSVVMEAVQGVNRPVAIRVDANGGWSADNARRMLRWLADRDVELIEQPLARGRESELSSLHRDRPVPIILDESARKAADIPGLTGCAAGINLKLMKCGGIREGLRVIHIARACGLKVMMGCFSETSLGITAAAHLSPLADILDLDSQLNLAPDPFLGASMTDGRVVPNDDPGLGVRRADGTGPREAGMA